MLNSLEAGMEVEVRSQLMLFKNKGIIQFDKVLSIPRNERIPELIRQQDGLSRVSAVLTASINSAMDNMNLRLGLNEKQSVEISFLIIEQSEEDYLSIEDVLLFLQELLLGRMGKIYDRMDIPTFFELFERYRQERHQQMIRIKEEHHIQNKAIPVNERFSDLNKEEERGLFREAMNGYMKEQYSKPNDIENDSGQ